jgi:tellurite resistance protein TehA-like permease
MRILRDTLHPEIFRVMVTHPVQYVFIGTFPMRLATIVNMLVFVYALVWGQWARYFAWGLWILDAVISVMTIIFAIRFVSSCLALYEHLPIID